MPPEPAVAVPLRGEETEAVARLQQLGFPHGAALQAYLACEMNETMAANLLFDGMHPQCRRANRMVLSVLIRGV